MGDFSDNQRSDFIIFTNHGFADSELGEVVVAKLPQCFQFMAIVRQADELDASGGQETPAAAVVVTAGTVFISFFRNALAIVIVTFQPSL